MSNFAQCPPSQSGEGNHTTFSNPNVPLQTREYALAGISGMLRSLAGAQGAFTSRGAKPKGLNLMLLGLTTKQTKQTSSAKFIQHPLCRVNLMMYRVGGISHTPMRVMHHSPLHHHLPRRVSCSRVSKASWVLCDVRVYVCVCVCVCVRVHVCVEVAACTLTCIKCVPCGTYVSSRLCVNALLCVFVFACAYACVAVLVRVVPMVARRPSARTPSRANRQVQTLGTSCTSNAGLKGSQQLFCGAPRRVVVVVVVVVVLVVWATVSNMPPIYQVQAPIQH